jgi:hypothetical protein
LVGVSDVLSLYDHIAQWGKFVHATEGLLVAAIGGFLLLGLRDRERLGVHDHIVALVTMFVGVTFGAFWELLEFALDWVRHSDLQKSNTDTMTDMLWTDLAVVLGTLLAFRTYYHVITRAERAELGDIAISVFAPIGRLLDRHGKLSAVLTLVAIALYLLALWYSERPLPFVAPR